MARTVAASGAGSVPEYPAFRVADGLAPDESVIFINRRMRKVLIDVVEPRAREADLAGERDPVQRRLATLLSAFVKNLAGEARSRVAV